MSDPQLLSTNPKTKISLLDDWTAGTSGNIGWTVNNTGAGSTPTNLVPPDSIHMGILSLNTGTTTTGHSSAILTNAVSAGTFKPYSGSFTMNWLIQVPILSNATDRFQFRCGFGDLITADFQNGIYFEYDDSLSANWRAKTASASSRTVVDTGVSVSAGAWVTLSLFTTNAAASYSYAINGTTVATISATIPSTDISPDAFLIKSAGTTSRSVYIDYFQLNYNLSSSR